jgi:hypothetical protein
MYLVVTKIGYFYIKRKTGQKRVLSGAPTTSPIKAKEMGYIIAIAQKALSLHNFVLIDTV